MGRGTSVGYLPPVGTLTASQCKGLVGKHLATDGVACCPINHTSAAQ